MEYDNGEILRGVLKIDGRVGRAVRMRQCEAEWAEFQNLLSENLQSEEFSEEFAVYALQVCNSVSLCL